MRMALSIFSNFSLTFLLLVFLFAITSFSYFSIGCSNLCAVRYKNELLYLSFKRHIRELF